MTREISAGSVLGAGQFPLVVLHRLRPEYSLAELIARSQRVGDPVRLSMFHLAGCDVCPSAALAGAGPLCAHGARLVAASAGWRPRGETP